MGTGILKWIERGGRWLLAMVWFFAAVPKLANPPQFAQTIAAYGLLPDGMVLFAAIVLPVLELVAAFLLLRKHPTGLYLTAFLLLLFIGVLSYGLHLGLDIDCGCFGPEDPEHKAFSGLRSALIRDLLLVVPLAYSFWSMIKIKSSGEKQ